MAKQVIVLGTTPNDSTGTPLRDGGDMINDNFTELYDFVDQNVNSGDSPTFDGTNFTGIPNAGLVTDPLARANHTGTQLAATISDFDTEVSNNTTVTTLQSDVIDNENDISTNVTAIGLNTTHRTSDGSDHSFIDQDVTNGSSPTFDGTNMTGIPLATKADRLEVDVRNSSGAVLSKGQAGYISGYHVGSDNPEISEADADLGGAFPVFGLIAADIANNANGTIIVIGKISGVDTSTWTVGVQLYLSTDPTTTLGLTDTKPTGAAAIQKIGKVLRSHATLGEIEVIGAGREAAVPNIPSGQLWLGNGSGVATPTTISGDVTIDNAGVTTITTGAALNKGTKTTAQRNALSPSAGWTCFDTDINKHFYYNGAVWLVAGELMQLTNKSGLTLAEGHVVRIESTTDCACDKNSSTTKTDTIGVVFEGGALDTEITVAIAGKWNVLMTDAGTIARNEFVVAGTTAGISVGFTTAGTGDYAKTMKSVASTGAEVLVPCIIRTVERF